MSSVDEAPWLNAWRAWTEAASGGFQTPAGQAFASDSAAGLAEPFRQFARAIEALMKQCGAEDFARRLIETLHGAARFGSVGNGEDFLNAMLAGAPRALLGVFPDAGAGQAWLRWASSSGHWAQDLLSLPSIGPQREWQEMLKAVQVAALEESQARAVVDEHHRVATRAALSRLAAALEDHGGPPIRTLRALYDLWIDQAEAAYAERVMSAAYARDFAAWVNAGGRLRLAVRKLGGRLTALFDAPAREEVDALLARQQAMQRELAVLRAERDARHPETPRATQAPARNVVAGGDARGSGADAVAPPAVSARNKVANPRAPRVAGQARKPATAPRATTTAGRAKKPTRGEFDIGHILDSGK